MGFNRTWPRALRFGCYPYGELQLKHIELQKFHVGEEGFYRHARSFYKYSHYTTNKIDKSNDIHVDGKLLTCRPFKC